MTYGPDRLVAELQQLGYGATLVLGQGGAPFAVIPEYEVPMGRFAGRLIGLGLPATPNFPQSVGASIHIRAEPQLLEYENVPNVRNIIASALGPEWRYWSHQFNWTGERERSAARLMAQVAAIFDRA